MKNLLIIPLLFANFAFAEIYEDYEPSQQVTQLTVISVQPNYMDNYLHECALKNHYTRGHLMK